MANPVKMMVQPHQTREFDDLISASQYWQNETIKLGVRMDTSDYCKLHSILYRQLKSDSFHSAHTAQAIRRGSGILKSYFTKKKKRPNIKVPYVKNPTIDIAKECYKQPDSNLEIAIVIKPYKKNQPRTTGTIALDKEVWGKIFFDQRNTVGQLMLKKDKLYIPYARNPEPIKPKKWIGIDLNTGNITTADSNGKIKVIKLDKLNETKARHKNKTSNFKRQDHRVGKKIKSKHGKRETNRANQIFHDISNYIISQGAGIVLEDLTNIRKRGEKKNCKNKKTRRKIGNWGFKKLQNQIKYKAEWAGLPVKFEKAHYTSSKCHACKNPVEFNLRDAICKECDKVTDRDVNASLNILEKGTRACPDAVSVEEIRPEIFRGRKLDGIEVVVT